MTVCITGMHRSGTSMVAHTLLQCGLDLGPESEMIPAGPDNAEGFWENRHFVGVNDRLLEMLGGGWDMLPPLPEDWRKLPDWPELYEQAIAAARPFEGAAWGWKDPRTSVLLSFWMAVVPDLRVVICLRNPLDVANSLHRRGASSQQFGIALWRSYNQRLLECIPQEKRLVTHYDAYFPNPEAEVRRVSSWIGLSPSDEQVASACRTVRPGLQHVRSSTRQLIGGASESDVLRLYLQMCGEAGAVYQELAARDAGGSLLAASSSLGTVRSAHCNTAEVHGSADGLEMHNALCDALLDRHAWRQEVARMWDLNSVLSRQLEQASLHLQEARHEMEAMRRTWAWRCATFAVSVLSKFRQGKNAPSAPTPTVLPIATLPKDLGYLARQVWIVVRAQGPYGVWQAWRKRRQMIQVLRDIPQDGRAVNGAVPLVSIVIPVFNNLDLTRKCLQSIVRNSERAPIEIIVVDNASSDGTDRWLAEMACVEPRLRHFRNSANLGFGMAVNQGAGHARGKFIVVANNDLLMTPSWLSPLVELAESNPHLGVVSPVTNYVGQSPQMLEEFAHAGDQEAERVAAELARRALPPREVPDRLVFFCVLIRRSLWHLLGGLSISYGKGNFEDDDFCLRARLLGYRLIICQRSFVYHYGSQTFLKQNIPHEVLMMHNRGVYHERLAEFAAAQFPQRIAKPLPTLQPLFSLIIRTVDRAALLTEALRSLVTQFYQDFEVIVVNDGGPDAAKVIELFTPMLRIRQVRHEQPRGRSAAWNTGIREACGRFLCQLDDDDVVYPNHFAVFADAIAANPQGKIFYADCTRALFEVKDGTDILVQRLPMPVSESPATDLQVQDVLPIMTFVVARGCYEEIGGVNESLELHEDWDVLMRLSSRHDFHHVRRSTSEYRFRFDEKGMSNSTVSRREESLCGLLATYERYPSDDRRIRRKRDYLVGSLRLQIRDLASIQASDRSDRDKAMASICLIAGFTPV